MFPKFNYSNAMNRILIFLLGIVFLACESGKNHNIRLFNGQDLSGWHADVPAMDNDPDLESPFFVRDGKLVSMGEPNGHLITDLPVNRVIAECWCMHQHPVRCTACSRNR
jgi:hypothetical protein